MDKEKELIVAEPLKELSTIDINSTTIVSENFSKSYEWLVQKTKQLEEFKKMIDEKIKAVIQDEFMNTGNQSIKGTDYNFAFVPANIRESIDTKRLKKEQPDVYKQYVRTSSVKSSLRVTPIKTNTSLENKEDDA